MKPVYFLFILLFLPSCWPCDPVIIDLGDIPDDGLAYVPYREGDIFSLEHSEGLTISYSVQQESYEETSFCEWCCDKQYVYEMITTKLTPNYPVPNIEISMNNMDTSYLPCTLYTGGGSFMIPTNESMVFYGKQVDSLQIGLQTYYNVYLIVTDAWDRSEGEIYTDSLYYNYEFGILKLIVSNGEYYQLTH